VQQAGAMQACRVDRAITEVRVDRDRIGRDPARMIGRERGLGIDDQREGVGNAIEAALIGRQLEVGGAVADSLV
jgi:hypothetical protein